MMIALNLARDILRSLFHNFRNGSSQNMEAIQISTTEVATESRRYAKLV